MKSENSKLVLGLLAGAAVGAAIAYLCTTDKKEKWIESANSLVERAKDSLLDMTNSVKEVAESAKSSCKAAEAIVEEKITIE